MTSKELAHAAQQTLQTRADCDVKRSHVHELLAAAFGHSSWAAFQFESVLADGSVGDVPAGATPQVIGRAVQLQYAQGAAVEMAGALLDFVEERQLSSVWMRQGWPGSRQRQSRVPRGCAVRRSRFRSRRWSNWPVRAMIGPRNAWPNRGMPNGCEPQPSGRWRRATPLCRHAVVQRGQSFRRRGGSAVHSQARLEGAHCDRNSSGDRDRLRRQLAAGGERKLQSVEVQER